MFESIVSILASLVLLAGVFKRDAAENRIQATLSPFQGVIGLVALVVGVLNFSNVIGLALIAAGLILAAEALSGVPGIGDELERAAKALGRMGGLVGAVLLVLAVYRLIL